MEYRYIGTYNALADRILMGKGLSNYVRKIIYIL